jgi:hypothetical protein
MNATVPACGVVSATVSVTVINCRTASTETAEEESTEVIPEVKDIVQENLELEVYPNPTEGLTRAKVKGIGEGTYQLMVLDVLGHTILMQGKENKEPGSIYWDLDFRNLAKGVYLIKVMGEGIEKVERVVVR